VHHHGYLWTGPKQRFDQEAAAWLGEQLGLHAPRFVTEVERDIGRLARRVDSAVDHLAAGSDVSYGFYLERPAYLSLALVTCSPNRTAPELPCPVRE
jgi:hypothetical protein